MKYILSLLVIAPAVLFAQKNGQEGIDSMLQALSKAKEDTNKVILLNRLTSIYISKVSIESAGYGEQSLHLAEKLKWNNGIAIASGNLGIIYNATGDHPRALANLFKALRINEELENKGLVAENLNNIGDVYSGQENYSKALECYLKALKINREIKDTAGLAVSYDNIASVYSVQKKYTEATEYHFKSLEICQQMNDKLSIAATLNNIGDCYHEQRKYYIAFGYYHQAVTLNRELNNSYGYEITLGNIGRNYLAIAKDTNFISWDKTMVSARKDNLHKAVVFLDSAIKIEKEIGDIYYLQFFSKYLAEARELLGDTKAAFAAYKDYTFYKDSVFSKTNKEKISSIEHQRELELKETKIKLLRFEADKEKLTKRILVVGIVGVLILTFFIVMYFIKKQKGEKLIANEKINTLLKDQELRSVNNMLDVQENERRRIASDLHDRLGSMLSTVKLYFGSVEDQIDKLKEQNKEQYNKANSLLDEACDEVRKISHDLVSGELVKFGLISALEQLATTIENTGQLKVKTLAFGMTDRLDTHIEIALYRVIQELLNNILKHSKATEVTIQVNKMRNDLNIVVEDNGIGFDIVSARAKGGIGLQNMEARVGKLNGKIQHDSGKGKGTTTIIDIPV